MKKYCLHCLFAIALLACTTVSRADTPLDISASFVSQSHLAPWLSVWKGEPQSLKDLVAERYFFTLWQPLQEAGLLRSWKTVQLKLNLTNSSKHSQHLLIVLDEPAIDKFSVIQVNDQGIKQSHTAGNRYPFFDRPITQGNLAYPVDLAAGEQLSLLIEIKGRVDNLSSQLSLWQRKAYFERTNFNLVMQSMYSGIVLVFMAFNLLLFIAVRERCYFWFALFSLSMFIRAVERYNLSFEYLWPSLPVMQNAVFLISLLASSALMPLFIASYLNFARHRPKLNKIYQAYALLHLPFLIVLAASDWQYQSIFVWLVPTWLFSFLMLVNIWQSFKKGSKGALWLLTSYGVMVALSFVTVINRALALGLPSFIENGNLGELVLISVMSVALSLRIGQKQAKAQASFAEGKAKNEFLAKMSHEIRTPINGVIGMAQLLSETPLSKKQQHYADVIRHCSNTLLNVINDILEYSKIEAGKLQLEQRSFRLDELLLKNNELFWPQIQNKHLQFVFNLDPKIPMHLIGDVSRIQQMLNNLFSNAIKFTEAGRIELIVSAQAMNDGQIELVLTVKDTGIGMSEDEQQRIFKPFVQAKATTNRLYGGSGLGLNITRQIVGLMQGRLSFSSRFNEGSRFSLHIPLSIDQLAEKEWQAQLSALHSKQILLLSERSIQTNTVYALLEAWHIQPVYFNDSNDALNYLEQTVASADAILISKSQALQMTAIEKMQWHSYLSQSLIYDESFSQIDQHLIGFDSAELLSLPYSYHQLQQALFKLLGLSSVDIVDSERLAQQEQDEICSDLSILVAEDDATNRLVIRAILKKLHVQHEIVANGRLAFESYNENPTKYDLILMDYEMPEMDGCMAASAIRQLELQKTFKRVPIVALTAHVLKEHEQRCRDSGMDCVLAKPIQIHELLAAFKQFCRRA